MNIRVKWLGNHGAVVTRRPSYGKKVVRFVRPDGTLAVMEAAAALSANDMRIYRLIRAKRIKVRVVKGEKRIPLAEVKRLIHDRREFMRPIERKAS